jgi:hypothetical protein
VYNPNYKHKDYTMTETLRESSTLDPVAAELARITAYYIEPAPLSDQPDASRTIELQRVEEAKKQAQQ